MKHRGKQRRHYRRLKDRHKLKAIGSIYYAAIHSAINSLNSRKVVRDVDFEKIKSATEKRFLKFLGRVK